jgi:hypothetical protein
VVGVGAVDVAATVVQHRGVPIGALRQVAPIDGVAIQGKANDGRVGSDGGVVGGRVQALGPKGVPVQVRDAPTLPNVLLKERGGMCVGGVNEVREWARGVKRGHHWHQGISN